MVFVFFGGIIMIFGDQGQADGKLRLEAVGVGVAYTHVAKPT